MLRKFIGTKAFYHMVLTLAAPLLVQNALSTFVNLLDNLMVGQVGTESMSGVSIVNQLLFVYNLCIFGGLGGAGIYAAQYHGHGDEEGVRHCLRFSLYLGLALTAAACTLFTLGSGRLISAFLHETDGLGNLAETLRHGQSYLAIMLWGLPPFAVTSAYAGILRVTGDTRLPMRASLAALLTNLVLNWFLIFGKCGFPVLGVRGAAIATVISRYVEAGIIVIVVHTHTGQYSFASGLYRVLRIPRRVIGSIASKSFPILFNELFWSLGQTMLTRCYSVRGLTAIAALNIYSVVTNLFSIVLFTLGNCTGIILGNALGSGELERARDDSWRLMALSTVSCAVCGALLFLAAPLVPRFYNTYDAVRELASQLMRVYALFLPVHSITNVAYFTLRSGGKTLVTVLFDSVFSWVFYIPTAALLVNFTSLPLVSVLFCVCSLDILKAVIGITLVRKGIWVKNIVVKETAP